MGRRIYCNGDFVYKYNFGKQESELYKLDEQHGVGKHNMSDDCPQYTMTRDDIIKLDALLDENITLPTGKIMTRRKMVRNFRKAERRLFGKEGLATFDRCDLLYGRKASPYAPGQPAIQGRMNKNYTADVMFWSMASVILRKARMEYRKGNTTIVFEDEW
jgi:hypothetical protein